MIYDARVIPTSRLAAVLVEVADTLVKDFDLNEFIDNLAADTAALIGVDAVGVLLAGEDGDLAYMGASGEDAKALELLQLATREGPCVDSFLSGEPVIESNLGRSIERWPSFVPAALKANIHAVHAFPLRLRDQTIGGLNVFGRKPIDIAPEDVPSVQSLADLATIAILQAQSAERAENLTRQLQTALNRRVVVEQAKGALSRAHGVTVDQAWAMMRTTARAQQVSVTDLAQAIVRDASEGGELYI